MSLRAPLRVPIELTRTSRWWVLGHDVSLEGLSLSRAVPDEVEGPLEVSFVLPGATAPLHCHGEVYEVVVGERDDERAERRALRFLDLDEDGAARIQSYVQERLGIV